MQYGYSSSTILPARRLGAALLILTAILTAHTRPAGAACETRVLYDASQDARPDARPDGLSLAGIGAFTQTVSVSRTVLDSAESLRAQVGYLYLGKKLDRGAGIALTFDMALLAERHNSPHRAGFSVILLGADKRGIELGFWPRRIWAQQGGKAPRLFTAAEGAPADTRAPRRYRLRINGDAYSLSADNKTVLRGAVRDYTAFDRFPDVYETPNFVFLGDNSASAGARVALSYVALSAGNCSAP